MKKGTKDTASRVELPSGLATGTSFLQPVESLVAASAQPTIHKITGKRIKAKDLTADIIADLIIDFCNEHGDLVTNLRLQKLIYFSQAWHLAIYSKPLFADPIEAWVNGPVQSDVYARFAAFGYKSIEQDTTNWDVPKKITSHIAEVMAAYGHMSAYDLERLARNELPWNDAREGLLPDESSTKPIDNESMRRFYRSRLDEQEKKTSRTD